MDYDLPSDFDLIVVGTGLVESIVSAAASRVGKRVLHVDSANYYGSIWASFNLDGISNLLSTTGDTKAGDVTLNEGEKLVKLGFKDYGLRDFEQAWYVPVESPKENLEIPEEILKAKEATEKAVEGAGDNNENKAASEETTTQENAEGAHTTTENITSSESKDEDLANRTFSQENLLKESRKFNIDLAPKLHFARGDFVELLISSNIARYSEFCSVSRVLTWLNGQLETVPCSRSDVFSNSKVTVIEKRMLMKLLTACMDEDQKEFVGYENKTFLSYLKDRKLTANLVHFVLYAIAMSNENTPFSEGISNTRRFLNSLGRFGKTPFLFSLYGSGDITQAFCRLSAVFGGIYALNQELQGVVMDKENNFKAVICNGQRIAANNVVIGVDKAPEDFIKPFKCDSFISRGIFITNRSILESEKEHLTLLLFPPEDGKNACTIIEVGYLTRTCPKNFFIVHVYCRQQKSPKEDLKHCVQKLFNFEDDQSESSGAKPKVLWSLYFSAPDTSKSDLKDGVPNNVFLCPGPDLDLDYDFTIQKAKNIFKEIYPDADFLPRAPDPDEIIIGDEAEESADEVVSDEDIKEEIATEVKEEIVSEEVKGETADSD